MIFTKSKQKATLNSYLFSHLAGIGKRPRLASIHSTHQLLLKPSRHKIPIKHLRDLCKPLKCLLQEMTEAMNLEELRTHLKKLYLEGQKVEEGIKYLSLNGKSLKKSASVWSPRAYFCEECGITFAQCHTLHRHKKYHCPKLEKEQVPNEECANCGKRVSKTIHRSHAKNGCLRSRAFKEEYANCDKMVSKKTTS